MSSLPIDHILPELRASLEKNRNLVLSAEPGAGKTTRVPVSLMEEKWLNGKKIIMLEPRRLAAIRSAEYMAEQRGEKPGESIGYRIRGESVVGKKTRLEVVTEGILTRMLQDDAGLEDVGLLIFDEFHERSIHADLGLALSLDVQQHLRNDLKILVMSATINATAVSDIMGNAQVIHCDGRSFPVEVQYLTSVQRENIEQLVVSTTIRALRDYQGDILVFLPGQAAIRKVESLLTVKELSDKISIHLLYGESSSSMQRSALLPSPEGKRKIILSTNIAETSLTINGVRIVIDAGLMRTVRFDPRRGMSGLVTLPISQASADQRKGRAGREGPGICFRLWTETQHSLFTKYSKPEIIDSDLSRLALEFAQWGNNDGAGLRFLDPPPKSNLLQAKELLHYLGALDKNGMLTVQGKQMAALPVHPRIAHMVLTGHALNIGILACDVAALLDERDVLRGKSEADVDLFSRYSALREEKSVHQNAVKKIREQSLRLRRFLNINDSKEDINSVEHHNNLGKLGILLALAYPERIGKRKSTGKYQLSGNTIASLPKNSMLAKEEYLAIGEVDGAGSDVKIYLAEPITEQDILATFSHQLINREEVTWDSKEGSVIARKITVLGALILFEKKSAPPPEKAKEIILRIITDEGLTVLPWTKDSESFRMRSEWVRKNGLLKEWVDLSDKSLLSSIDTWLSPFLDGMFRRSQFTRLNMMDIIRSFFTYHQLKELDHLAPSHLTVPTDSRIQIDYSGDQPILAVRLQEMFGETKTPTVGGGKVNVLLHLLSPARRPLAVTQDLQSFWKTVYPDVRKDMRGEYPKHYWPEDPLDAEPTKKTKRAMEGKSK